MSLKIVFWPKNRVEEIQSPHEPRKYKNIKELPSLDELSRHFSPLFNSHSLLIITYDFKNK
jgi:hypothetical protein